MAQEFYAVDLPGKSLYKEEFAVSVRRITPIEQKYILSLSQKEQKTSQDYINFIKKLVQIDNPAIKFEDLFWFDIQYLLYKIRFTTYTKYPIKLTFKCREENCNAEIMQELKIENLDILTPEDIEGFEKTVTLDVLGETPIHNKVIGDDITIERFMKLHNIPADDFQFKLLLIDLCAISGENSLDALYTMAENGDITAEDITTIENWIKKHVWGVREKMNVVCPNCGKEETRDYILSLEDFFSAV